MKREHVFSLPNQITYARILLIPVFIAFLVTDIPNKDYIAAAIFILLSLSDVLDGYIARKKKQVTEIGKIIDPIADKLLISVALIFLIERISIWMVAVIIIRELIVTLVRLYFLSKKVVISADTFGKVKTIFQSVAIFTVILNFPYSWWVMLIAVILTILSGLEFFGKVMEHERKQDIVGV